jgi:hypothetical protein
MIAPLYTCADSGTGIFIVIVKDGQLIRHIARKVALDMELRPEPSKYWLQ